MDPSWLVQTRVETGMHHACLNLEAGKKEGRGSSRTLHMRLFLFPGFHLYPSTKYVSRTLQECLVV